MTLEFLLTLAYSFSENNILEWLEFEYEGQHHRMTTMQVRECFCVVSEPSIDWNVRRVGEHPLNWWHIITGSVHNARDCYNYSIPNPTIALCQKLFAMCLCGKDEINKVPAKDLQYLWYEALECPLTLDWAGLFVSRCHDARTKNTGKIAMGGMITLLVSQFADVERLDGERSHNPLVPDGHRYTIEWLQSHHCVYKLVLADRDEEDEQDEWLWPFSQNNDTFIHLPK